MLWPERVNIRSVSVPRVSHLKSKVTSLRKQMIYRLTHSSQREGRWLKTRMLHNRGVKIEHFPPCAIVTYQMFYFHIPLLYTLVCENRTFFKTLAIVTSHFLVCENKVCNNRMDRFFWISPLGDFLWISP